MSNVVYLRDSDGGPVAGLVASATAVVHDVLASSEDLASVIAQLEQHFEAIDTVADALHDQETAEYLRRMTTQTRATLISATMKLADEILRIEAP